MQRNAFLVLFALVFAACDSGGDGTRSGDLVGTWGLVAVGTSATLTAETAQTYVAVQSTGGSTVEGSGAVAVRLPFARRQAATATRTEYVFATFDPVEDLDFDEPFQRLSVTQRESSYDAQLEVYTPETGSRYFGNSGARVVLSREGAVVTLDPIGVTDAGDIVQLAGTATFQSVDLRAGVPTRVPIDRFEVDPEAAGDPDTRYTFERGGDWRSEFDIGPSATRVVRGTWEAQDGQVRIEVSDDDGAGATVQRFGFQVEGSSLLLDETVDDCTATSCLERRAEELGLDGRLTAYSALRTLEFVETDAPFARPDAPGADAKASADGVAWPWVR